MSRHATAVLCLIFAIGLFVSSLPLGEGSSAEAQHRRPGDAAVDLDVLYVGAHPDDEAGSLAVFGQWAEHRGLKAGVITITRGEGGGNAVGLEEGPALGLLREAEERRAVGKAGITNVYNFDYVDFWYNLSAPLTEEIWKRDDPTDVLERTVRVLRMTRPEVIVTMNPGINHGHHQWAAWLAMEAFDAAADPTMFPEQLSEEGLEPFRAAKIFTNRFQGQRPNDPSCVSTYTKSEPTDVVYGVWGGVWSDVWGTHWAQVEREAQREYVSQGWGGFPDQNPDPNAIGCDMYTLIDSRVPFTPDSTVPDAMLEGAHIPAEGGLDLGSELYLETERFRVPGGEPFTATVHATSGRRTLPRASVTLTAPAGWTVTGDGDLGTLRRGQAATATFTVTPPADADPGRVRLGATLQARGVTGETVEAVEVVSDVTGAVELHPDVARFREFVREIGVEQVDSLIKARLGIGLGETREVRVDLTNHRDAALSGQVTIDLPAGFEAATTSADFTLAGGADGAVTFTVTNTDTALPTANSAPNGGDYDFTVTTTTSTGSAFTETGAFNLVPVTVIPGVATAPSLDGVASPGEYPGEPIDVSRRWEGQQATAEDFSGTAWASRHGDDLYILVDVTDDVLGAVLTPEDAKRHWRTDSVEITIDPQNPSRDPSTTFKVGVFPITDDPANGNPPAGYRDADGWQGPIAETAPGMEIASAMTAPYTGYVIEVKIPLADLPATVDPDRMGLNILPYDSDTQDKSGQTRNGWSTFGGVQASPYRWGHAAILEGYEPPEIEAVEPIIPLEVAESIRSPQSILQSSQDGVPLASGPPAVDRLQLRTVRVDDGVVRATVRAEGSGTAHVFVWDGEQVVAADEVDLVGGSRQSLSWSVDAALGDDAVLLIGWRADAGGTQGLSAPLD